MTVSRTYIIPGVFMVSLIFVLVVEIILALKTFITGPCGACGTQGRAAVSLSEVLL